MSQIDKEDLINVFSSILNSGMLNSEEIESIKLIDSIADYADKIDIQWNTNLFIEVSKAKYEIYKLIGERIVDIITGDYKCR